MGQSEVGAVRRARERESFEDAYATTVTVYAKYNTTTYTTYTHVFHIHAYHISTIHRSMSKGKYFLVFKFLRSRITYM